MTKEEYSKEPNPIPRPGEKPFFCKVAFADVTELGRIVGQPKINPTKNGYDIVIRLNTGAAVYPIGNESVDEWHRYAKGVDEARQIASKLHSGILVAFQGFRRTSIVRDSKNNIYYKNTNILTRCDIMDNQISEADMTIREIQMYDKLSRRQ